VAATNRSPQAYLPASHRSPCSAALIMDLARNHLLRCEPDEILETGLIGEWILKCPWLVFILLHSVAREALVWEVPVGDVAVAIRVISVVKCRLNRWATGSAVQVCTRILRITAARPSRSVRATRAPARRSSSVSASGPAAT